MTRGKNEELGKEIEPCDPRYSSSGPIGCGDFVISRGGGPTENELSNENLLKILMIECSDLEVGIAHLRCVPPM